MGAPKPGSQSNLIRPAPCGLRKPLHQMRFSIDAWMLPLIMSRRLETCSYERSTDRSGGAHAPSSGLEQSQSPEQKESPTQARPTATTRHPERFAPERKRDLARDTARSQLSANRVVVAEAAMKAAQTPRQ